MVWSFVSQFEVAEGILTAIVLLSLVSAADSFGLLFDNRALSRHLKPPLSQLCTALAALGALSFDLLVLCNMQQLNHVLDYNGWNLVQYPLSLFGYLSGSVMGQAGRDGYGALALLVWELTVLALSLGRGFTRAVKLFAIPSILFLTVVVFLFDPREMDSQAINLVSGVTFRGISLLSNWFLLTVSLFFTVSGLAYELSRRRKSFGSSGLGRTFRAHASPATRRASPPTEKLSRATLDTTNGES